MILTLAGAGAVAVVVLTRQEIVTGAWMYLREETMLCRILHHARTVTAAEEAICAAVVEFVVAVVGQGSSG